MKVNSYVVVFYGMIIIIGGLVGYLKADSLPSLLSGAAFGAILFASGLGLYRSSTVGYFLSLAASGLLAIFFSFRFFLSYKMMPAGMMALLSFAVFLLLLSTKGKPPAKK